MFPKRLINANDNPNDKNNEIIEDMIAADVFLLFPFVINSEITMNIIETIKYNISIFIFRWLFSNVIIANADIAILESRLTKVFIPFFPAIKSIKSKNITNSITKYLSLFIFSIDVTLLPSFDSLTNSSQFFSILSSYTSDFE